MAKKFILFLTAIFIFFAGYNASIFAVSHIVDGDLLTTADSFDIYIVKIVADPSAGSGQVKKFKRLILNPEIFNSYGHLKWENVKTVSQGILAEYTLSEFAIEVNPDGSVFDPRVYRISSAAGADTGERSWLNITGSEFESLGYDWDSIYHINHTEASPDFYTLKLPLTYDVLKPSPDENPVPADKPAEEPEDAEETVVISFSRPDCNAEVPTSHASIQSAIDASQSGETICILAGTYEENIKIDGKDVILSGAGAMATIIKAVRESATPDTSDLEKNSALVVKNVSAQTVVEKMTISNGNYYGIWLDNASVVIKNNIISDNFGGMRILGNSRPNITYNVFFNNTHGGGIVYNGDVGGWAIDHNTFVDNGNIGGKAAILFDSAVTNAPIRITNNIFSGGVIGIRETVPTNSVINNNLFYGQGENYVRKMLATYNSVSALNGLTFAANNLDGDPALEADYRPWVNSPVIDAADDRKSNIGAY